MLLRPIEKEEDWQAATNILIRGFQERPPSFWIDGLNRIRSIEATGITRQIGYLLQNDGEDIGVILTLRTHRKDDQGGTRELVNLAGWYVDERFRWYAPRMLSQLVSDEDVVFTDLTSIPAVRQMLPAMHFKQWNQGLLFSSFLLTLWNWRKGLKVMSLDELPQGSLSDADRNLLEDHEKLGCIACVLKDGETFHPLVFLRQVRWKIPVARVIYAPSVSVVIKNLSNVLLYLIKHNIFFIALECNKPNFLNQFFLPNKSIKYYKGDVDPDMIDFAYSELVLFDL